MNWHLKQQKSWLKHWLTLGEHVRLFNYFEAAFTAILQKWETGTTPNVLVFSTLENRSWTEQTGALSCCNCSKRHKLLTSCPGGWWQLRAWHCKCCCAALWTPCCCRVFFMQSWTHPWKSSLHVSTLCKYLAMSISAKNEVMLLGDGFIGKTLLWGSLCYRQKASPPQGAQEDWDPYIRCRICIFLSLWLFRSASFPVIVMMRGWSTGTKAVSGKQRASQCSHLHMYSAHTYTCIATTSRLQGGPLGGTAALVQPMRPTLHFVVPLCLEDDPQTQHTTGRSRSRHGSAVPGQTDIFNPFSFLHRYLRWIPPANSLAQQNMTMDTMKTLLHVTKETTFTGLNPSFCQFFTALCLCSASWETPWSSGFSWPGKGWQQWLTSVCWTSQPLISSLFCPSLSKPTMLQTSGFLAMPCVR